MLLDTQIISYQFKGQAIELPEGHYSISSITANEFLLAQPREKGRPDYYVAHPAKYNYLAQNEAGLLVSDTLSNPKWAKIGDRRTDRLVIDFGNQFAPYREYGNEAIAIIINEGLEDLYRMNTLHLPKKQQKYLKARIRYILSAELNCVPLDKTSIEIGMCLFSEFVSEYECKDNVRNTINDILILSTAIGTRSQLVTKDSVLNRFAAKHYGAAIAELGGNLHLNFADEANPIQSASKESKGYVNRGWSYSLRNGNSISGA